MKTSSAAPARLGDLLVDRGYLTPDDLTSALDYQKQQSPGLNKLLGEILIERALCTEDQIAECLAREYGVPYAKLESRLCDQQIIDVLPREYVEENLVLP